MRLCWCGPTGAIRSEYYIREKQPRIALETIKQEVPALGPGLPICAPGRAHSLGGESPLHTRQGEVLAERQRCPSRDGIGRKLQAKRWPDEQEADRGGAAG